MLGICGTLTAVKMGCSSLSGLSSPACLAVVFTVRFSRMAPAASPATASNWGAVRAPPFLALLIAALACLVWLGVIR